MSSDSSKPKKRCVIIHRQPRTNQDSNMSQLSSEIFEAEDEIQRIISKTSVTLSWRESCILTGTPLYELNPSLMKQPQDTTVTAVSDRGKESAADNPGDRGSTAVTCGRLEEWLRQNAGTEEDEERITSETSVDVMSEYGSDDLLGIWFKAEDSATWKVPIRICTL